MTQSLPSAAQAATPATVLAYCAAGHSNAEAARQFGINERTVRKWKARARNGTPTTRRARIYPAHESGTHAAPIPAALPVFHGISPTDVARDGVLWKCPKCEDWHHPLPETTGAEWNAKGCYQCATPRPADPPENMTPNMRAPAEHNKIAMLDADVKPVPAPETLHATLQAGPPAPRRPPLPARAAPARPLRVVALRHTARPPARIVQARRSPLAMLWQAEYRGWWLGVIGAALLILAAQLG